MRPELQSIVDDLLARDERVLSLDVIAERVGAARVTSDDIEEIFAALEAQGKVIGDPTAPSASAALGAVLATAKKLRTELGRTPNPREIAEASGLTLDAVRLALLFARIAQR